MNKIENKNIELYWLAVFTMSLSVAIAIFIMNLREALEYKNNGQVVKGVIMDITTKTSVDYDIEVANILVQRSNDSSFIERAIKQRQLGDSVELVYINDDVSNAKLNVSFANKT